MHTGIPEEKRPDYFDPCLSDYGCVLVFADWIKRGNTKNEAAVYRY